MKARAVRRGVARALWLLSMAACSVPGDRPAPEEGIREAPTVEVVHAATGGDFRIYPGRLPSADCAWRLAALPEGGLLRLKSKGLRPGGEVWTFEALSKGSTRVEFKGVSTDAGGGACAVDGKVFRVIVHPSMEELDSALAEMFLPAVDKWLEEIGSPMAGEVSVERPLMEGRHAKVEIKPLDPDLSGRTAALLELVEGRWRVIGMGSSFSLDFLESNSVPKALREGYGGVEDYEAPPESVCTELAGIMEEVLGIEPRMEECRFDDHVRGGAGRGCRIQAQGGGGDLPEPEEIGGRIAKRMESLGWSSLQAYEAVGPMGSAKGFEKADLSAFLRVVVEPAEEVGLLSIKRPLLSELLPEELVYTVILEAAGRP
ncbi:MAG: hypothetical protein ACLFUE_05550 [Desulfobacteraceae bacterium]